MPAKKKSIRKPSEAYQACPACKSKNLLRLEVDVLCGECDWMSCEEYVEMGGMDNLFLAFREHFPMTRAEEAAELVAQSAADAAGESEDAFVDERRPIEVGA